MNSSVLMPNIIAIVLLIVLLFSTGKVSNHFLMTDTKIFVMMLACNLFQCVGEIVAYAIDGKMLPGFHTLNLIVNMLLFIVNIYFAFLWVIYANYKVFESYKSANLVAKKMLVPALIVVAGTIVNLFVPVFFRITENNEYQRTSLFFLPYLITYLYLTYGTVFIYRHRNNARKYVFLPAGLFMIPIIAGSLVQFFFYGYSTTWVGVAIALVAVYVNIQNEASYTDTLSGLYTRIYMYQYLENKIRQKDTRKKIVGIMLDIDDFKRINDTYGHLTGDEAIRSVGKTLHQILPAGTIAARYGGDEFVVLREITSEEDIGSLLHLLTEAEADFTLNNNKSYHLHCSKGYSVLDPAVDSVDTFLERLDREMYASKKA